VSFKDVMREIVNIVNFIRSHGLNDKEFQQFLSEVEAEHDDVFYYTEVRLLSRGKVLKRVFELKDQIGKFVVPKRKPVHQFSDPEGMTDFGYLTDISLHLCDLNIRLQDKSQFIHNLYDQIKSVRTNSVYGKFIFKRMTSHTFKPYHNVRILTLRNLSSAQGPKISSQIKHC
jgi:hypothetical protein